MTYRFKHARTTFCMPALNITAELSTRSKNAVVVFLVMHRPGQAVSEHAFGQWRQFMGRVIFEERGGGGRIALCTV
jgi:hypothetical protein